MAVRKTVRKVAKKAVKKAAKKKTAKKKVPEVKLQPIQQAAPDEKLTVLKNVPLADFLSAHPHIRNIATAGKFRSLFGYNTTLESSIRSSHEHIERLRRDLGIAEQRLDQVTRLSQHLHPKTVYDSYRNVIKLRVDPTPEQKEKMAKKAEARRVAAEARRLADARRKETRNRKRLEKIEKEREQLSRELDLANKPLKE
jgi:hypothetical protein